MNLRHILSDTLHAKLTTPSLNVRIGGGSLILLVLLLFTSCSSDEAEYDPYYNWEARNTAWYAEIADSARTAISSARRQHGNDWESHCQWRMFKSLL